MDLDDYGDFSDAKWMEIPNYDTYLPGYYDAPSSEEDPLPTAGVGVILSSRVLLGDKVQLLATPAPIKFLRPDPDLLHSSRPCRLCRRHMYDDLDLEGHEAAELEAMQKEMQIRQQQDKATEKAGEGTLFRQREDDGEGQGQS